MSNNEDRKVKKDIQWLKEEVLKLQNNGDAKTNQTEEEREIGRLQKWAWNNCVDRVYELIGQLDEPEIPSQGEVINIVLDDLKEHIKEQQSLSQNVGMAHTPAGSDTHYRQYDYVLECIDEYEPSKDLQNLLVPSQELPVIPKFVANWIEEVKSDNSLRVAFEHISQRKRDNHDDELAFWIEEGNSETFARAWLDGFTVEKEPLYRARLKVITNGFIAAYLRTQSSDDKERLKALEIGSKYIHKDYRHLSEFTEEELKRLDIWDSEHWEIEELEE